jgi:hypothetical protein
VQILVHPLEARHYSPPRHDMMLEHAMPMTARARESSAYDMGLAPGGRMHQKIEKDQRPFSHWNLEHHSRCFVHLANSIVWRAITGDEPPTVPPTAAEYTRHDLPWFEYYGSDRRALDGGRGFDGMKSVREIGEETGRRPLSENESVRPRRVVRLRRGPDRDRVREWEA